MIQPRHVGRADCLAGQDAIWRNIHRGDYRPETLRTIAALRERAVLYGCEELAHGSRLVAPMRRKLTSRWRWPIAIILMPAPAFSSDRHR